VERNRNRIGIAVEIFIDGVIYDFPNEMVQPLAIHAPDIHRRPLADRFETLEDCDVFGGVRKRAHF
jgi:hypothetical protein